ncbi:DMT family transporter [Sphingomonas arantia]|uniref:DMT family transporter n=1 Tax=Sphingomonas arantia TaxID=1460676 RepID=A0ABW4U1U2_9SPHN
MAHESYTIPSPHVASSGNALGGAVTSPSAQNAQASQLRAGWAYGLLAAVIWGGYLAVSRHGIAAGLGAADLAFIRYGVAGPLLLPWLLRHSPLTLAGIGWRQGVVLSLLAGPLFVLVGASGFRFAPLAHGAVIQLGTVTLMSAVLAWLLVGERLSATRILGLGILVAGLAVIAGPSLVAGGSDAWIGDLLFALAGMMWALFTVLQRQWAVPPLAATAAVSVLSAIIYSPLYLWLHGTTALLRADAVLIAEQILVQGILSGVVALFAFGRAVQILGAGRAALFPALAPAVAIMLGIPLTGEIPDATQIAGLLILSAGLAIAVRRDPPIPSTHAQLGDPK